MSHRRRGAELERALLEAAWAELDERGYARLTMDAVAARARTSPSVLYRRWSGKQALTRAAIAHMLDDNRIELPDTGSLRGDVLTLMRHVNATRTGLATVLAVHLAGYYQESGTGPSALRGLVRWSGGEGYETIYARAVERGEIPASLPQRVRTLPFTMLRHEILMTLARVPDGTLVEIVDTVFLPLVGAYRDATAD